MQPNHAFWQNEPKFGPWGRRVAAAAVSPAAAQSWQDYSYPEYAFSVAFPGWRPRATKKRPALLDVSVFLQHGAVLDQMEPLPWFPLVPLSSRHDRVEGQRFILRIILVRPEAPFVSSEAFFLTRRVQFASLTARDRIPGSLSGS
jgi:hypothetical protein